MESKELEQILLSRFGKDSIIALATTDHGKPAVRNVDAFYENGVFYVLTSPESDKATQIQSDPSIAVAASWFTAKGKARICGGIHDPANADLYRNFCATFHG